MPNTSVANGTPWTINDFHYGVSQRSWAELNTISLETVLFQPSFKSAKTNIYMVLTSKDMQNFSILVTLVKQRLEKRFIYFFHFPAVRHLQCHVSCTRYLGNICNSADCVARQLEP